MSWFGPGEEDNEDDYQSSGFGNNSNKPKNIKGNSGKLNVSQPVISKSPKGNIDLWDENQNSKSNTTASLSNSRSNGKVSNTASSSTGYTVKEEKNATTKKKVNGARMQMDDDEPVQPKQTKTKQQNNFNDFENANYYSNDSMNETDLGNKITNLLQELQSNTSKIEQATKKIGTASDTQENRQKSFDFFLLFCS